MFLFGKLIVSLKKEITAQYLILIQEVYYVYDECRSLTGFISDADVGIDSELGIFVDVFH